MHQTDFKLFDRNYRVIDVAETGKPYDEALFNHVIALRDRLYLNDPELESPEAIRTRLAGTNKAQDPVELKIKAVVDGNGDFKAFSILETYLDDHGKPISSCMTYAAAEQEFARAPGGREAMHALHKQTVAGVKNIIVEINPGDPHVHANAKRQAPHEHPLALDNNDDPLVTKIAIKLGMDPGEIPLRLVKLLHRHATATDQSAPLSPHILEEMTKLGQLKNDKGEITSVIAPVRYNTLNLDADANPDQPFVGGPPNLHMAGIVHAGEAVDYDAVRKGYEGLSQSIMAGNGETPMTIKEAQARLEAQPEYQQTLGEIDKVAQMHAKMQTRPAKGEGMVR